MPERSFDSAVVFLPKSKDLTDYCSTPWLRACAPSCFW
jgi:hypothetical protein